MRVDILLATRNGEKFLEEALISLLNQSHTDIKILVSDDASCDNTREILKKYSALYPDKLSLYFNDTPSGSAKANFFTLMEHAEADYIMFCDQDDVWHKNKVEVMLEKITQTEKENGCSVPALVHSDLEVCDASLNVIHKSFFQMQRFNVKNTSFSSALVQNVATGCTVMVNRALLEKAKGDNDSIIMHDWWVYLYAAAFGRIGVVRTPLIKYRQHSSNTLGAQKIGAKKDYRKSIADTQAQAKAFFVKYGSLLEKDKLDALKSYTQFENYSKLKKIYYLFKYRLWKHSLIRRLGQIWFI